MNNIQKTIVGVLALAVLVLGGLYFNKSSVSTEQASGGSVTGPDSFYPCTSSNGVTRCFERRGLTTATTTVCAIKSPSATSTLVSASVQFVVSTTTASRVSLAKAATAYATTTSLGAADLAAGARGTFVASTTNTTNTTVDGLSVFGPSQYFVVGVQGGSGTFSPTGSCQATFEIN